MKRLLFLLSTLCLVCAFPVMAQERLITLSEENSKENWPIKYNNNTILNISVAKDETDRNGKTNVTLTVENFDSQQYVFLLFGKGFDEKDLKTRFKRRIVYSKNYGPHGNTEVYQIGNESDNLSLPNIRIDSDYSAHVFSLTLDDGDTVVSKLPIYIAKNKNGLFCRRTIIESEMPIMLGITIETEIQKDYYRLCRKCDSLIDVILVTDFCMHKLHQPSLSEQEAPYLETRDSIVYEVRKILREYSYWTESNRNYLNFKKLLERLNDIDELVEEREIENCGDAKKHRAIHDCDYCKWTLKQIYNKLDLYNKQLDNERVSKESVIKDVGKLYKCYRYGPKNSTNKRKEQMQLYKSKIEDLYNKINSY